MSAPRIVAITASLPLVPQGARLFQVVQEGSFADRSWAVGDVLVCVPGAEQDESAVVLVARGHGRPRLGSRQGHHLRGEVGELCSPERWLVAGAVVAVLRSREHTQGHAGAGAPVFGAPHWHLMHRALGGPVATPGGQAATLRLVPGGKGSEAVGASEPGQLSLFAA